MYIALPSSLHSRRRMHKDSAHAQDSEAGLSDAVVRQTDFDVTTRQCVNFVSDGNLARAVLIRLQTRSDGGVQVCRLP